MLARALVLAAVLVPAAPAARAADLAQEGADVRLTGDAAGGTLVVFGVPHTAADGTAGLDVHARRVGADGQPEGEPVLVGRGAAPGPGLVGDPYAVAYDRRRGRWLVAWSGHERGMATKDCTRPPSGPFPTPGPPCVQGKREVLVRVVDARGRPVGSARRVTRTGSRGDPDASGTSPAVAYDRRSDRFLLVSVASPSRSSGGPLVTQLLGPGGAPAGARAVLRVATDAAETVLVGDPRGGFLLGFDGFGGADPEEREIRVRSLSAAGRPRGRTALVSRPGGAPASSLRLGVSTVRGEALALWDEAGPGASRGFHARRLSLGGKPKEAGVALPFTLGTGRVDVVGFGAGWLYGVTEERPELGHAVVVRRGGADGRVVGASRVVADDDAVAPALADLGGGRALVGWTLSPVSRGPTSLTSPPPPARPRALLVRP